MADGFYGLLDFTGLPVGIPEPSRRIGGGGIALGKKHVREMLRRLMTQEMQASENRNRQSRIAINQSERVTLLRLLQEKAQQRWEEREQQQITDNAIFAVLLSEV